MFAHKVEGNTLYIYRKKDSIYINKPWQRSGSSIAFISAILCFVFDENISIKTYLLALALILLAALFEVMLYNSRKKQQLIKITKPPGMSTVIVNNTIYTHPHYLYNMAELIPKAPYIIYIAKKDGDSHPIVDNILEREDMYAMMELLATYLEIQCRKDN